MKVTAIRLDDERHAQLTMIAQLENLTMIDAIRQAIDQWVAERRNHPELQQRAQSVLDDIERDASTRRQAIAALFDKDHPPAPITGDGGSAEPSEPVATPGEKEPIGFKPTRSRRPKGGTPASR